MTLILQRIVLSLLTLLFVSLATFTLLHAAPGDPIDAIVGDKMADDPQVRARIEQTYGLDKPLPVQYVNYVGQLIQGNFGISISSHAPVSNDLKKVVPATFELAFVAITMAVLAGVPLGILAAVRKDRWPDHLARGIAIAGASIPVFWMALVMAYLFSVRLGWFPRSGQLDVGMAQPPRETGFVSVDALLAGDWDVFTSLLRHIFLPALVLALFAIGLITRMLRSSLLDALSDEYVRTARAKGLPERNVVLGHALRNALIPTVTILGLTLSALLTGAALVETIFSWPGMGQYAVRTAFAFDYPALLGVTLIIAVIYITVSLIIDIAYALIDPRIRVVR